MRTSHPESFSFAEFNTEIDTIIRALIETSESITDNQVWRTHFYSRISVALLDAAHGELVDNLVLLKEKEAILTLESQKK